MANKPIAPEDQIIHLRAYLRQALRGLSPSHSMLRRIRRQRGLVTKAGGLIPFDIERPGPGDIEIPHEGFEPRADQSDPEPSHHG